MKKILTVACALLCLGVMCAEAKGGKKKKKAQAEVVKVDTVPNAVFSYAYGMANTQGLKNYLAMRAGIDTTQMASFMRGFDSGTQGDEFVAALKAYVTGTEIRRQVELEVCRQIDQRLSGNDSTRLVNRDAFIQGFRDAVLGNAALQMDSAVAAVDKNSAYYTEQALNAKYGEWRKQNTDYLAANAKNDSVKTTASGLQYKVLTMGEGEKPSATDKVKVHYEGKLIDGTVFDSSYKRNQPATFGCGQVIKGWTEALQLMPVGSKWVLYIPQELAYGTREQGQIKPFSALVFTVELLSIEK